MTAELRCDLLVIGAGSGGVRAARTAASLGAKVAIAEPGPLGGTCVHRGCVPKKLFVYAAEYGSSLRDMAGYGWNVAEPRFDWPTLVANTERELGRLGELYRTLLLQSEVEILRAPATFINDHHIRVGDRIVVAERVLIATGSWPRVAAFPGGEHCLDSAAMFRLPQLPKRMAVIGGGYIALEFAGIMHRLGVQVSLLYRGELFLRGFDHELREFLAAEMRGQGMDVRFNSMPASLKQAGGALQLQLTDGTVVDSDAVLYAAGRQANTAELGLENTAVRRDEAGYIAVDSAWQTEAAGIYAVGDVIGGQALTPVAIAEGEALARNLFGGGSAGRDPQLAATAVFGLPQLASVGLSEELARAAHGELQLRRSRFRPMRANLSGREEQCLVKLVALPGANGRVLGAHMVGPDAAEIIQGLAVALQAGATIDTFCSTLALHPSTAEEFVLL